MVKISSNILKYIYIPAILILLVLTGSLALQNYQLNKLVNRTNQDYLEYVEITNKNIETVNNTKTTLSKELAKAQSDNQDLLQVIAQYKNKPQDIKYIVETKTVIVPSEPIYITPDLPSEYNFNLHDNLTVARFEYANKKFKFETFELTFKADVVIAKNKTSSLLKISSAYEPNIWHEYPIDLSVKEITEPVKLFTPHISLGLTVSLPKPELLVSLSMSTLHFHDFDFLSLRISGNSNTVQLGLDPISYNIGKPLPVLTDLWISPGISIDQNLETSGTVTFSTKF